jgi:hypothetical protein
MRKLFLIFTILLFASLSYAGGMSMMIAGGGSGAVACVETAQESLQQGADNAAVNVGFDTTTDYLWASSDFIASGTYYISKIVMKIERVGSGTGPNFTVKVYNTTTGAPTTLIKTSNTSKSTTDFTTAGTGRDETFLFDTGNRPSISNTGAYAVILTSDGKSSTDYATTRFYDTVAGRYVQRSTDGTTWVAVDNSGQNSMVIYANTCP